MTTQVSESAINELMSKVSENESMVKDKYSVEEESEKNYETGIIEEFDWEFETEGMTVNMTLTVTQSHSRGEIVIKETYNLHYQGYKMDYQTMNRHNLDKKEFFTEFGQLVEIAEDIKSGEVSEFEGWSVVGTNPYTLEKAGIQMYIDDSDCIVRDTISNNEERLLQLESSAYRHPDTDAWIRMILNAQKIPAEYIHADMVLKNVFRSFYSEYDDMINMDVVDVHNVDPEFIRNRIQMLEENDVSPEKREMFESTVDEYEDMLEKALEDRRQYLRQQYEDIDIEQISS